MSTEYVKIVVYVPVADGDKLRDALSVTGCGHIGNYDSCSFTTRGIGRFRGLEGSNPSVGKKGIIEEVEEERIETICRRDKVSEVIMEIRKIHPYEEPAVDIYQLLNEGQL